MRREFDTLICEAIRRRTLLAFHYKGHPRVVAPYCHGISTRDVEVLRAVQVRGSSSSGLAKFGKLWEVGRMVSPKVTNEPFTPDDPQYNPNDTAMKEVHCRV